MGSQFPGGQLSSPIWFIIVRFCAEEKGSSPCSCSAGTLRRSPRPGGYPRNEPGPRYSFGNNYQGRQVIVQPPLTLEFRAKRGKQEKYDFRGSRLK